MATSPITFQPYAPGTTDSQGQRISSIDPRLSRSNYFDGRLLKASDLVRDQIYVDERALEIGQVMGSGIVQGLDLQLLDNDRLRVGPGLAIATSGRVLQLSNRTLEVNLGNSAVIATLNQGYYRRFQRGLYLVALQYAEVGSDSAEVYPADLASPRGFHYNSFAEGVELVLVPLNIPLAQNSGVAVRAGLVNELLGHPGQRPELSDEAVALGLLAMDRGRPLWLDRGLVRRSWRQPGSADVLQQNLATHYTELLDAVLDSRAAAGLVGGFAASQYFQLLPPMGQIPKSALDPVAGSQMYFPAGYEVSIAPVRRDDLPAILQESARLAPMDLQHDADADIMVLVPLSNSEFAWRGRGLESEPEVARNPASLGRLLAIDRLALRLTRTLPKPHQSDTDAPAWKAIWALVGERDVVYVRRPPRSAETNVSAVMLARGFTLPKPTEESNTYIAVMEQEINNLRQQLNEAQQDLNQSRADFDRRLRDLRLDPALAQTELAKQLNALQATLATLNKQLADLQASSAAALAEAQQQIGTLNAQLSTANNQISALTAQLGDSANQLQALQTARDQLAQQLADLQASSTANLNKARDQINALTTQLTTANKQIAELKALLDQQGGQATLGLKDLAKLRPPRDAAGEEALAVLDKLLTERKESTATLLNLLLIIDRRYDPLTWPSLALVAQKQGLLEKLLDALLVMDPTLTVGLFLAKNGAEFGLSAELLKAWRELG